MSNYLITGGAGFIGSNLAGKLIQNKEDNVVILDDLSTGKKENLEEIQGRIIFIEGSILDLKLLNEIIKNYGIEYISHQAAWPSVLKSIEDPLKTNKVNIEGTLNVLKSALDNKVKKVVVASSSSVYGDTPSLPEVETMRLNPKSPYGVTKVAKELYTKIFSYIYGLKAVGLRYFNVYGPKQDPFSPYAAVIPKFINAALRGEPLTIEGDGDQTRDFTYIDDVVQANICALNSNAIGIYNISYGKRISINELATRIIELTESPSEIIYLEPRKGDIRQSLADNSKAIKEIGYTPKIDLEKGLRRTINWFAVRGDQKTIY